MGTPLAEIGKAFLKSGAKKTEDIVEAGATGQLKTEAQEAALKEATPEVKPVEPTPVETPTEIPTTQPVDEVAQAEAITTPTDLEMGLPSGITPGARNINFDNIKEPDEVLTVIDNIGAQEDQFIKARGGVVSQEQTVVDAAKVELEEILGFKLGDGVTPARITGARIALTDSASRLQKMAKHVLDGEATTAEKLAFRQSVSTHVAIQQSVAGMSAEAGRSLNAFRIPVQAGMQTGDKTAVFRSQLQETFERSGGDDTLYKLAEYIEEAGDDLAEVTKRAKQLNSATTGDFILEYWINGLLSSPATHMVNVTSNAMVATWSIPERMLASGYSKLFRSEKGVEIQEAVGQVFGLMQGTRDGLRMFWQTLKTGEPSDPAMKLEARKYRAITAQNVGINTEGYLSKGVDLLGNAIRMPGRFLGAEDEFFKSIGYRMELNAIAYRKAASEGLEGEALGKRIIEIVNNPTEEIHLAASDVARVQTFTNPLGESGQKVQQLANSHPALKLILPFVRTPVNIVKFVGMRSPLAPFAKSFRADMMAGGARRDLALSRMSLGSLVLGYGATMAADGIITGGGPKNKAQRDALRRQGWQPYSMKVGDKYYSFNRLDPLGMFLGLSADLTEVMKYAEDDQDSLDLATAATISLAKNLTSRTYLRGLSDVMNVITDPDRYAERFFQRQAASFTPMTSLVANIEREFDPTIRATYSMMDEIKSRTPGLSDSLPPRRNLYGEPIVLQGGLGIDFVSPIYSSTREFDFVDNEIVENEVNVSMPRRSIGTGNFSIELNAEEYDRYVVLAGKELKMPYTNLKTGKTKDLNLHKYLQSMMASDMYQSASEGPDGGRAMLITTIVNAFRDGARATLLDESEALKAEWDYQKQLKVEAKTGKPLEELLEGY